MTSSPSSSRSDLAASVPDRQCCDLVGTTPRGGLRKVSLAARQFLRERTRDAGAGYVVALAVSGGADSLAMAVCVADCAHRMQIPVLALVVDHAMRAGSDIEARQVCDTLTNLGIAATVLTPNDSVRQDGALETVARDLRHGLLTDAARSLSACGGPAQTVDIFLGHTMDDQAETVLMRLAQGASPGALAAMAPLTPLGAGGPGPAISRARPLLAVRRADTASACADLRLACIQDPTNASDGPWRRADGGPLPRAGVRDLVLPALKLSLGQDVVPALARLAALEALDEQALGQAARDLLEHARRPGGLDLSTLRAAPAAVRARALLRAALDAGASRPTQAQIQAMDDAAMRGRTVAGTRPSVSLAGGVVVRVEDPLVVFTNI